jgi:DNA-binding PadR family transcriptional regulator
MDKISKDQMGANSVLIILLILKREDSYGYSITQELKTISSGRINWKEGSLYPVLKKMEANEFVKSYWNLEESDRPRKYYTILEKGETEIERLFEERDLMISIIDNLKSRV